MKSLLFLAFLLPAALQSPANLSAITQAISQGDATTLGNYFDESVEVSILDKDDVYAKADAIGVVRQFFSQNRPSGWSTVHKGAARNNDSQYCIGNLTANGQTFRVYIYMKEKNGRQLIQELRFDRE
ncbi:MAG: DUF4783 domain-containing protein [bacterium]|nr:DUF4783 domain-containing protein [bacterium]